MANLLFTLEPVPPFRLDLTAWTLRRRAHNAIDRWDGRHYRRALVIGERAVEVTVTQRDTKGAPLLDVALSGERLGGPERKFATTVLDRMLGLSIDLRPFHAFAAADQRMDQLAGRFRGMKPVRYPSIFEGLVNAIACQQLSLDVGIHVLNALTREYGRMPAGQAAASRAFPSPETLAGVSVESLRPMGFSRQKAQAVIELAGALAHGGRDLELLADEPDVTILRELQALRGIGRWSAEYVLLRGYGRVHQFPGDDVGAWHGLERWLALRSPLDYERAMRITRRWHPYAGLVYFHLLLDRLQREGHLDGTATPSVCSKPRRRK